MTVQTQAPPYAHSPGRSAPGRWHGLREHAVGTAELAREFGDAFGMGEVCYALGLHHDAGKASCAWQQRLLDVATAEQHTPVGLDHKQLGAHLVAPHLGPSFLTILGHHGGLPDSAPWPLAPLDPEVVRDGRETFVAAVPEAGEVFPLRGPALPPAWVEDPSVMDIGIRMVFSALVDADHLDTAAHFGGYRTPYRGDRTPIPELLNRFLHRRQEMISRREPAPVDHVRAQIFQMCLAAAQGPRGIYRLPAPTGSGKTLSSAGFALTHAAHHGMRRVIVAVPFKTVTEQNASVYRDLLGSAVIEHHSDVTLNNRSRATDNWDSPFVVTTTVQLFDSLFGRKPGRSRKLHRLAGSVIVLDEVQALPESMLPVILEGLRVLVEHFGVTVLLASATQPTFEVIEPWRQLQVHEIGDPSVNSYELLRRVDYTWQEHPDWQHLAAEVSGLEQALVIVNTTSIARDLAQSLQADRPDVLHLSTRMCPAHRHRVLSDIRDRLRDGRPCLVVATQLVEAGVDLDFPVVYRQEAPADALQQAAGRANREGRLSRGRAVIFTVEGDASSRVIYGAAANHSRQHFGEGKADPDDIEALSSYYRTHYAAMSLESHRRVRTIEQARASLNFRAVAEGPLRPGCKGDRDSSQAFRMIEEDSATLLIEGYDPEVHDLIDDLLGDQATPHTVRALQPFSVSMPRSVATRQHLQPQITWLNEARDLGVWTGTYDPLVGIDESEEAP